MAALNFIHSYIGNWALEIQDIVKGFSIKFAKKNYAENL